MLVDESHRSQYWACSHARMRQVFPNACYHRLHRHAADQAREKRRERFGGFIHTYTIDQAVADKAVVPLLYEGRLVESSTEQGGASTLVRAPHRGT